MTTRSTRFLITLNTLAQFFGRIISSGTSFLLTIVLARSLGTDGYGDFTKVTTFVSFFYLFADFGMNAAYIRLQEQDTRFTFRFLMATRLLLAIVLVFLSVAILVFLPQGTGQGYTTIVKIGIVLYSLSILSHALITTANAIFQQKLRYDLAMVSVIIGSLVKFVVTLAIGTGSIIGAIISFFIGSLATMGASLSLARVLEKKISPTFSLPHMTAIAKESFPLALTLIFNLIYFRIDTILLTLTQPTADVGVYNLAYNFFEFSLVFPVFFMNALYPVFLKRKEVSFAAFYTLAKKAGVVLTIASLLMMALLWITSPYIVLIKESFEPSIAVVKVLSLSLPFFFLTSLTMWMLITLGKRQALIYIYAFSMTINVLANIFFLPRFGYIASAWITIIGEMCILVCSLFIVLREGRQNLSFRRILHE